MRYINITFISTCLVLMVIGCKVRKLTNDDKPKNVPEEYASRKDSVNSGTVKLRDFISDPDLTSLIEIGIKNNFDMLIALQRIEGARSGILLRNGALFPTLSANFSFLGRKFGYYTMDDAGNRTTEIEPGKIIPTHLPDYYVGLQTAWEIDIWGKLRNRKKAAFARYFSSVEGKNLVLTHLVAEIANNYYELLALDNELDIIRETIKVQESALDLITLQKENGIVNGLAVQQFRSQLLESRALEYEVVQQITETENTINFLLGRYPQNINRNKTTLSKEVPLNVSVGVPSDLLRNRPDILQAEFELIASKADVKAAKAAFYPSLNINGSLGLQGYKAAFLVSNPQSMAYSILGSLITPLINRSAIKAEFKFATSAQLEALFNYQKSVLNGYVEVYNQIAKINNLKKVLEYRSEQALVQTQAIETSSDLFKTGRASYIEVLLAQKNSLESRLGLIEVQKRQYNSMIDIYKALGGGWQ